ncbi:MAG: nucleotidyltransferase family protein, partial [Acidimicrobiales bacterium]
MVAPGVEPIAVVAAHGLPGARTWPGSPMDDDRFHTLLDEVVVEKLTGHLVGAIETGALPATEAQHGLSTERHDVALVADLTLERLLVATSTRLREAGIRHRGLKGPVLARTTYPDPALRSFADIDVLIEGPRFDDAVALLVGEGGHRRFAEPRRGFTARFGKGVCVETERGLEIDLHRVFTSGPFGLAIDDRDLF